MFGRVSGCGASLVITGCNSDIGFKTFPCARSPWWARQIGLARTLEAARDACQRPADRRPLSAVTSQT